MTSIQSKPLLLLDNMILETLSTSQTNEVWNKIWIVDNYEDLQVLTVNKRDMRSDGKFWK